MCHICGNSNCNNCSSQSYSYNWNNIENYPCNPCSITPVCKKKIPAKCTIYNGPNLTSLTLTTGMDIELVLASLNTIILALQTTITQNLDTQTTKNTNILTALNDINSRINVITGGSHAPYTI